MNEIRSKFVKESLLDYEALANSLKENTSNAVRDLLKEAVRERYNEILSEADENEFEVEEVEDTESAPTNDAEGAEGEEGADVPSEDSAAEESDEAPVDDVAKDDVATEIGDESESSDEWAEFDQFKVGDGEYDFSQADDDAIVKVYKLLRNEDEVMVNVDKETNKVEIKDNETGAEYLIDMGASEGQVPTEEPMQLDDANGDLDLDNTNMNESTIYEVVLNEYDSHVGYTDNYQKKDVMTTPSMKEPGKNVNDWDAGVPKGSEKPWVGKKGDSTPFNEENEVVEDGAEETIEEAGMNVGGFVQQNSTSRSNVPNSNGRKARNMHQGAKQVKGTAEPRYQGATNESKKMLAKVNKILKENEELKIALGKFKTVLKEAAVTNLSLGNIIKLISENSTTKEEKQEIISRFGQEARTIEESKNLYESISRELKKRNTMNINEDKQFTANGSQQINETTIYQSKDLLDTLDLMNRICR